MKINTKQIQLFSGTTEFSSLDGGEGDSVLSGDYVIKPVYEIKKYKWLADELRNLKFEDIAVSLPAKSKNGNYVEDGAGAAKFIPGAFFANRMKEKLEALRIFNSKVKHITKPITFSQWQSPWTQALDIAWNPDCSLNPDVEKVLIPLLKARQPLSLSSQFVHVDPAGNILFDGNKAVIIDVSPGFYPKEFSEAVLICDSIAWYDAPVDSIELLALHGEIVKQLIIRTVIFRASVCLGFDASNAEGVKWVLDEYKSLLTYAGL